MRSVRALLIDEPLLLLFLVAAVSYPLGRIRFGGASLGVAAVLFVGLAVGAIDPQFELPEVLYLLGLVLFVYSVGLTSASGLASSVQRRRWPEAGLLVAMLVAAALLTAVLSQLLTLTAPSAAGMFAGSFTNTPALAAVVEQATRRSGPDSSAATEPVIAYSLTYPVGVLGMIGALAIARRLWGVSASEHRRLDAAGLVSAEPVTVTIRVTQPAVAAANLDALRRRRGWHVVFSRLQRQSETRIVIGATTLQVGDILTGIGAPSEIARVVPELGEQIGERIDWDRRALDYRRVFVSNRDVAGRRLGDLALPERFGAVATRVRRGDVEMLATEELVLELGDRIRVVTDRTRLDAVSAFFGDSYRALSEIDILAFSVGPALGLLLGHLPIPLPGGTELRLGIAGGPLVVALLLGYIGRTGQVVWVLPYSANLTLRQVGLLLFLAAIGTRAGWEFRTLMTSGDGLLLIAAGAGLTCFTALATLWIGYRVMKLPFAVVGGLLAALQTQPAALAFAVEQARSDIPNVAYARLYPLALVSKILLAQLLLQWLAR